MFSTPTFISRKMRVVVIVLLLLTSVAITFLLTGLASNMLVQVANGNCMPNLGGVTEVTPKACYVEMDANTKLPWLADRLELTLIDPPRGVVENVVYWWVRTFTSLETPAIAFYSVGDVFVWFGKTALAVLLIPLGVNTAMLIHIGYRHKHPFFAEFRYNPHTSRLSRMLIDSTTIFTLLLCVILIVYGTWLT